jgi:anti-anti-sigma factor
MGRLRVAWLDRVWLDRVEWLDRGRVVNYRLPRDLARLLGYFPVRLGQYGEVSANGFANSGRPEDRVADLNSLAPGSHLCFFFADEAELNRAAAAFVGSGLDEGDQMLYLAGGRSASGARSSLTESGAATDDHLTSGQLVVRGFSEVYGSADNLDIAEIAGSLRAAAGQSRDDGFPGFRVAAEMEDLVQALGSLELVRLWERMCSRVQQEEGFSSVCQYSQRHFDDPAQMNLIAVEHTARAPTWVPQPLARFHAIKKPWGLRVAGELDASNRAAFGRALQARLAARPRLRLDVRDLSFIDMGSLADLYESAAKLPWHGRIVLAGASVQLRQVIEIAEFRHPQVVIES